MIKKILLIALACFTMSCADQTKRQAHLQAMYPKCKVEPATGLVQNSGYDFVVIDTSFQIIAVSFYHSQNKK